MWKGVEGMKIRIELEGISCEIEDVKAVTIVEATVLIGQCLMGVGFSAMNVKEMGLIC